MSTALQDKHVVITRALEDNGPLQERLQGLGAHVHLLPCIQVQAGGNPDEHAEALLALPQTAWVAFASRNGVRYFAELLERRDTSLPGRIRLAAVGKGTAEEVTAYWRAPDLIASVSHGAGLATELAQKARPEDGEILLPAAKKGREELRKILQQRGFAVRRLTVYETLPVEPHKGSPQLPGRVDFIVFASPSSVEGFLAQAKVPKGANIVSIGPATSRAIERANLHVAREAREHNLDGLIEVLTCNP